jgi:hypothetical protein
VLKKSSGALFSELLGSTVFIRPGAAVTRDAPELPCAGRRVLSPELPQAGLLLVVSGDFFFVASYCSTKNSRVLKKRRYSLAFSPPSLLLRSRRRHGFFFDFFRPCPNVAMFGALQRHQLS